MNGTCPLLTFTVNGRLVRSTASTQFSAALCLSVKVGDIVEVEGEAQGDGSVTAKIIRVRPPETTPISITGSVTSASGICPLLTLNINGRVVRTTATTQFSAAACLTVKVGDVLEVEGDAQADGTVTARVVRKK